jgi:RimJ/RimL family protein N-acetyltransferase
MKVFLQPTTLADYEDYYMTRSDSTDIYWNGHNSPPDKAEFYKLYCNRIITAPFKNPGDVHIFLIKVDNGLGEVRTAGFIHLIMRESGTEIGCSVIKEYQGKGLGTKALGLAVDYAREHSDIYSSYICVRIRDDNIASQKMAQKSGFKRTDEYEIKKYPKVGDMKLRTYKLD